MGTPVVFEWPLDLYILILLCRLVWGSSVSRGGSAEISVEVLMEFFQNETHRGCDPVTHPIYL